MKVLLTGSSGFLGRYVLQHLHQQGVETVLLGRQPPSGIHTSHWIAVDLLDNPDVAALVQQAQATHLLHLAWYAEHGQYWNSLLNLRWVEATTRLTEAFCQAGGQQVVVAGTCAEYDWSHGYCREESTPLHPATLYGIAKDAARRLVIAVCQQYQIPCAWGRIFLPFGTGESSQRLIPSLLAALRGQRPNFGIYTNAYRDFLHASDVAAGLVTLLQTRASGAYNVSSGQPLRLEMLVRHLADILHVNPEPLLALGQNRPHDPPLLVGESQRLQALGWCPALTLVQALHQVTQETS
ncbi:MULTISPECIES: NAD-dependent epimerase/dehydratase family protein [Giesbergeria]|uniref:NAD-dependent epimerase/dehydratase family protein n=1 Tax=Giesbergeria sinuosa TaxID=80883 RepID=A0ABV9QDC7_9BURK